RGNTVVAMQRLLLGLVAVAVAAGCSNKSNGHTGQGGQGGPGGQTGSGGGQGPTASSVYERNNHPSRDGHFLQPTLTKTAAAKMAIDSGVMATYSGSTWASPLYLENGPGGKGIFIVVTNGNNVFALDETT